MCFVPEKGVAIVVAVVVLAKMVASTHAAKTPVAVAPVVLVSNAVQSAAQFSLWVANLILSIRSVPCTWKSLKEPSEHGNDGNYDTWKLIRCNLMPCFLGFLCFKLVSNMVFACLTKAPAQLHTQALRSAFLKLGEKNRIAEQCQDQS